MNNTTSRHLISPELVRPFPQNQPPHQNAFDTDRQLARRVENLERTQDLMPQALNSRLLLALRTEALRRQFNAEQCPRAIAAPSANPTTQPAH